MNRRPLNTAYIGQDEKDVADTKEASADREPGIALEHQEHITQPAEDQRQDQKPDWVAG